jgi:hypothetical protein
MKHQKRSVAIPQSVTPAKRSDHSAGLSAQSLPSLTTYAIIAVTRCIFASTAKDILLKFYLRRCRDPRCDADHEKPDSGWSSGGRAPAVVENGRLPAEAVAG